VTDAMFMAAAKALAGLSPAKGRDGGRLLPPVSELRSVAVAVATAVARQAQIDGLAPAGENDGLAERIASGEEPDFLVMAVANELRDVLVLRDCRFTQTPVEDAGAQIEADGSVALAGRVWQTERLGLPTRRVALPVRGGGAVLGWFVLTPTPALPIERERCVVAVALADQLGAALTSRRRTG
jgi:hypothetical protein